MMNDAGVSLINDSDHEQAINLIADSIVGRGGGLVTTAPYLTSQIVTIAQQHGVAALLHFTLKNSSEYHCLSRDVQQELLKISRAEAALEAIREVELSQLVSSFKMAGIELLLLKGTAYAYTHYPESYLRCRDDIDILIRPKDIKRVCALFEELNYRCLGYKYKSHQFTYAKVLKSGISVAFDVHWRLSNKPEFARLLDFPVLKKHSIPLSGLHGGVGLSYSHSLFLACIHIHGAKQNNHSKLIWLYDVHLLLARMGSVDVAHFTEMVCREGVHHICLAVILKCQQLFKTRVSSEMVKALSLPPNKPTFKDRYNKSYLALVVSDMKVLADKSSRLELLKELFLPSMDEIMIKYGKRSKTWLPFLYFRYYYQGLLKRLMLR